MTRAEHLGRTLTLVKLSIDTGEPAPFWMEGDGAVASGLEVAGTSTRTSNGRGGGEGRLERRPASVACGRREYGRRRSRGVFGQAEKSSEEEEVDAQSDSMVALVLSQRLAASTATLNWLWAWAPWMLVAWLLLAGLACHCWCLCSGVEAVFVGGGPQRHTQRRRRDGPAVAGSGLLGKLVRSIKRAGALRTLVRRRR